MTYRFHRAARLGYLETINHYLEIREDPADGFVQEVEHGIAFIIRHPEASPSAGKRARRYVLRHFPFALCYTVVVDTILIAPVAHLKRRPTYWCRRLHGV